MGLWYRSKVKLDGEMIVPIPPFEAYNPFEKPWYFPANELRQGDKSLYLKFLAVDTQKREEVVRFCERFGVLGSSRKLLVAEQSKLPLTAKKALRGASESVQSSVLAMLYQKVGNLNVPTSSTHSTVPQNENLGV